MKKQLDIKPFKSKLQKLAKLEAKHATFAGTLLVLIIYLFIVWQISQLSTADPNDTGQTTAQAESSLPKVDTEAIKQIQELEHRNSQIKSLFNGARNNPFQE